MSKAYGFSPVTRCGVQVDICKLSSCRVEPRTPGMGNNAFRATSLDGEKGAKHGTRNVCRLVAWPQRGSAAGARAEILPRRWR